MIISPKYKFVFLATEKTGCTSVQNVLKNIDDKKIIIGETVPKTFKDLLASKHTSCPELLGNHSEFKNYLKITYVRNPWDRVVSWYHFSLSIKTPREDRDVTGVNFKGFIKNFENIWINKQQNQHQFTKCCDFIGRFENLQEDFNIICDKIGIPQQELPHENKTKHKHYTEYYDEETKQIVAEKCAKDIEYFEYEFGE